MHGSGVPRIRVIPFWGLDWSHHLLETPPKSLVIQEPVSRTFKQPKSACSFAAAAVAVKGSMAYAGFLRALTGIKGDIQGLCRDYWGHMGLHRDVNYRGYIGVILG